MAVDSGTTVEFRRTEDTPFQVSDSAIYGTPVWVMSATEYYEVDAQVLTLSTGTTPTFKQWVCKERHLPKGVVGTVGNDVTVAASASAAAELDSDKWDEVDVGLVVSAQNVEISYPTSETSIKYLVRQQANTTQANDPVTITITLFDISDRQAVERFAGRGNTRIYVEIKRRGNPGTNRKGVRYRGYARLGETSISFPGDGGDITKTLNLTGDAEDAFLEEVYDGS